MWISHFPLGCLPVLVPEEKLCALSGTAFIWAGCSSCRPTNIAKGPKQAEITKSQDPFFISHWAADEKRRCVRHASRSTPELSAITTGAAVTKK